MNQIDNEMIETLFKVEPPLEPLEDKGYFGFLGVVLRNKEIDKIQCHICGEWFEMLTKHVQQAHKMKSIEYRKKFQLPLHFPLCSLEYSRIARETLLENNKKRRNKQYTKEELQALIEKARKKAVNKKGLKNHSYAYKCLSWKNKHGSCDAQLQSRYIAIADTIGKEPSKGEIEEHDSSLYSMIVRRFETLNKFREKFNFEKVKANVEISDESILGHLRNFAMKWNDIPRPSDFAKGSPNTVTIFRRFGSWNRALSKAGLTE